MKKSKLYTRQGDDGTTSLVGGHRVPKTHPRLEAYGTIDELNSFIGLLITEIEDTEVQNILLSVQHKLFAIGSYLATDPQKTTPNSPLSTPNAQRPTLNSQFSILNSPLSTLNSQFSILNSPLSILNSQFSTLNSQFSTLHSPPCIPPTAIQRLEQAIDLLDGKLPAMKGFVIPGGCRSTALAHVCRTVCRRAERQIFRLNAGASLDRSVLVFINRLSDLLFVIARQECVRKNIDETKHDFCKITKVHDNKNHASSIRP